MDEVCFCRIPRSRPDDKYDSIWLEIGTQVETEHTDDIEVAREIAKDHLDEFEDYYKELQRMEKRLTRKKKRH